MIIQIIYKLNPFALRALWWGFYCGRRGQESRIFFSSLELSFSGFCKTAAYVNSGVTLKGLRGVENAAVAVEESCVTTGKNNQRLIISSGRVLVFSCSLKVRYPFCNWKYLLVFSSFRRSFRESKSSMLPCVSCITGRSGTGERFCSFRYFKSSWGIFSWNPAWLNNGRLGLCCDYLSPGEIYSARYKSRNDEFNSLDEFNVWHSD